MGTCTRTTAWRCSTTVLAIVALVAAGSTIAATTPTSALPATLVGKWTRKVTSADLKRTGGYGVPAGTVCTLTLKKSGVAHLVCTSLGDFDGAVVPAGADRVHINLGIPSPNVYKWRSQGVCSPSRR